MINVSLFFLFLGVILLIVSYIVMILNNNYPTPIKKKINFCILIPARNESRVIENILKSIESQTVKVDPNDVFVIVESKKDETVSIVSKHNMNISFRKDLTKKRKGYALDDLVKEIRSKKKKYDAYFIFDADNVLDKNFMKEMLKTIEAGYDIGIGYRNTKNSHTLVSGASSLTFSMINTFLNQRKMKYSNTMTISGTGYYIKGELIEKWKGFPFSTLTEDYELTLYATLNNLTTFYNTKAIFFDEQPDSFQVTITQRSRWVKGYFEARKKYLLELFKSIFKIDKNTPSRINAFIGVRSIIYLIFGIVFFFISLYLKHSFQFATRILIFTLIILYLVLVLFSFYLLVSEGKKLNIKVSKIKLAFFNPLFLASFVICALIALFNPNLGWKEIKHDKNMEEKVVSNS